MSAHISQSSMHGCCSDCAISSSSSSSAGTIGGRVGSCPPNYNIGWAANVFCPPTKIFPTYIQSTELHSTNRKLRSTSTCRIQSNHTPVESAHPMKKSFPRYWMMMTR